MDRERRRGRQGEGVEPGMGQIGRKRGRERKRGTGQARKGAGKRKKEKGEARKK